MRSESTPVSHAEQGIRFREAGGVVLGYRERRSQPSTISRRQVLKGAARGACVFGGLTVVGALGDAAYVTISEQGIEGYNSRWEDPRILEQQREVIQQGVEDLRTQGSPRWKEEGPIQVTVENHREFFGALNIFKYKEEKDRLTGEQINQERLGVRRRLLEFAVGGIGVAVFRFGESLERSLTSPQKPIPSDYSI